MQDTPIWIAQPHDQIDGLCADVIFEATPEKAAIEYVSRIAQRLDNLTALIVDVRRSSEDHWQAYKISIVHHPTSPDDPERAGQTMFCEKLHEQYSSTH